MNVKITFNIRDSQNNNIKIVTDFFIFDVYFIAKVRDVSVRFGKKNKFFFFLKKIFPGTEIGYVR